MRDPGSLTRRFPSPAVSALAAALIAGLVAACAASGPTAEVAAPGSPAASTPTVAATPSPAPTPAPSPSPAATSAPRVPAAYLEGVPYEPVIDRAAFSTSIDHPMLPLIPGTVMTYAGEGEQVITQVTGETRAVMGIDTVVVRDRAFEDGRLVEDTADWYAQDAAGNVWYLGEDTAECEDGRPVSSHGAWEAGVNGALPGIVMLAEPRIGDHYRQEYAAGEAEDQARVVRIEPTVTVPAGTFADVLVTEDFTPLEPELLEEKVYALGVGVIEERGIRGTSGVLRLVEIRDDPSVADASSPAVPLCQE